VITWRAFSDERPDLADTGGKLLYQFGVGLAFLATSRADGGPRVHPMCPILVPAGLFAFIIPSPKRDDLHRDGRYAMHSFPTDDNEDAFAIRGQASVTTDEHTVAELVARFCDERGLQQPPSDIEAWEAFEFKLQSCLLTHTTGHGDPAPRHTTWHASG
jgi:hypothetical protein